MEFNLLTATVIRLQEDQCRRESLQLKGFAHQLNEVYQTNINIKKEKSQK